MNRITFFTKPDCSLCRSALYVIERVRTHTPFELERVDISAPGNERWFDAYRHDIPVVHLNGEEIFRHHVDERRLRELLTVSSERP
ncbi:MAG: glutaredoxin family protein [Planctomycetota bacterium]